MGVSGSAETVSAVSTTANGQNADASDTAAQVALEHPHITLLRRMTETLRRKWNVFDSELEAILKDAENHL